MVIKARVGMRLPMRNTHVGRRRASDMGMHMGMVGVRMSVRLLLQHTRPRTICRGQATGRAFVLTSFVDLEGKTVFGTQVVDVVKTGTRAQIPYLLAGTTDIAVTEFWVHFVQDTQHRGGGVALDLVVGEGVRNVHTQGTTVYGQEQVGFKIFGCLFEYVGFIFSEGSGARIFVSLPICGPMIVPIAIEINTILIDSCTVLSSLYLATTVDADIGEDQELSVLQRIIDQSVVNLFATNTTQVLDERKTTLNRDQFTGVLTEKKVELSILVQRICLILWKLRSERLHLLVHCVSVSS